MESGNLKRQEVDHGPSDLAHQPLSRGLLSGGFISTHKTYYRPEDAFGLYRPQLNLGF